MYQLDEKKTFEERSLYWNNKTIQDEGEVHRLHTIKNNYKEIINLLKDSHIGQRSELKHNKKAQKIVR